MPKRYWLVKQEPDSYPWLSLVEEGKTAWTGVRNFQARNNLRAMKKGDPVLYYHSGEEKRVVGLAQVDREHYSDPTAEEGDWSSVDLKAIKAVKNPVSLKTIKADPILSTMSLVRNSRLSVVPVTQEQFEHLMEMAG